MQLRALLMLQHGVGKPCEWRRGTIESQRTGRGGRPRGQGRAAARVEKAVCADVAEQAELLLWEGKKGSAFAFAWPNRCRFISLIMGPVAKPSRWRRAMKWQTTKKTYQDCKMR